MGDYRQLSVWKRAHGLALGVYRSTECVPARERYGLAAQMRRAAVSVISNIAEACGRRGDKELTRFLELPADPSANSNVNYCYRVISDTYHKLSGPVWILIPRKSAGC